MPGSGGSPTSGLWVQFLEAAARLCLDLGFRCTERHPTSAFGVDLDELRYDLDLP